MEFIHKKTGTDVVLGYDDVSGYERNMGYLGASIGSVANRIRDGKFQLDGIELSCLRHTNLANAVSRAFLKSI